MYPEIIAAVKNIKVPKKYYNPGLSVSNVVLSNEEQMRRDLGLSGGGAVAPAVLPLVQITEDELREDLALLEGDMYEEFFMSDSPAEVDEEVEKLLQDEEIQKELLRDVSPEL